MMERVGAAAERSGRHVDEIAVVAVSKTKSAAEIMDVYDRGHRDFGENRAAELAEKSPRLPQDIRWHYVGALQSNKVRLVRGTTQLLHSMDRRSLAVAWLKGSGLPPPVLVQVNVGMEGQKSGVAPEAVVEFVDEMSRLGIEVTGLMAIPPIPAAPQDSRPHFHRLRVMRDEVCETHPGVVELSMGMTDDFEVAIEEGASIIRVGRAIFGPRN